MTKTLYIIKNKKKYFVSSNLKYAHKTLIAAEVNIFRFSLIIIKFLLHCSTVLQNNIKKIGALLRGRKNFTQIIFFSSTTLGSRYGKKLELCIQEMGEGCLEKWPEQLEISKNEGLSVKMDKNPF